MHAHDPLRIGKGERPQQDGVDDAEDGGVGADTDRQAEHGDDGETRALEQHPEGKAKIADQGTHGMRALPAGTKAHRLPGTLRRGRGGGFRPASPPPYPPFTSPLSSGLPGNRFIAYRNRFEAVRGSFRMRRVFTASE